jgi:hypothetical protein
MWAPTLPTAGAVRGIAFGAPPGRPSLVRAEGDIDVTSLESLRRSQTR